MNRTLGDVGLLLLRLAGVGLSVAHGIPKLSRMLGGNLGFVDSVARLGLPFPAVFAWAAALSEAVGGLLLAAGLGTRVTAFFCASTMAVAAFLRHHAHDHLLILLGLRQVDPATVEKWGDPELALVYLAAFLALLLLGGGRFALERAFARGGGRR